jgi:pimeloyl-ACP methyl ester carboxylesterase
MGQQYHYCRGRMLVLEDGEPAPLRVEGSGMTCRGIRPTLGSRVQRRQRLAWGGKTDKMRIDFLEDPSSTDPAFPPQMHPLFIEERLLGLVYLADGRGPHKTLVLLHGFPGNEKNLDLAHMLRRAGFNVLIFHYSGSWGSRGNYSFGQAYRDLEAVRRALKEEPFTLNHRIDREKVYLAGHSVGGFLTLLAARNGMDFHGFAALAPYNLSAQGNPELVPWRDAASQWDDPGNPHRGDP